MFLSADELIDLPWQAYERTIVRLLQLQGFRSVRLVGQSRDKGADVIGHLRGRRWLVQVKHWRSRVGLSTVDETRAALHYYKADVPVIVSNAGFEPRVLEAKIVLHREGIPLQLWTGSDVARKLAAVGHRPSECRVELRPYQLRAIQLIHDQWLGGHERRAMVVLATGLGKTTVAAEFLRRVRQEQDVRVLCVAHTVPLVTQLERSFWPFLASDEATTVWTGTERPGRRSLARSPYVFATLDMAAAAARAGDLPDFDLLLIDECHHVGPAMYSQLLDATRAGEAGGPFLLGLTATPWRPDEIELEEYFGAPLVSVDIVQGLKEGFLADVDYRLYEDNIDWEGLQQLTDGGLTPKAINRALFIEEWDDGVVYELQRTWASVRDPRCIVFCGTIDHAIRVRDRVNALGFANAAAIFSGTAGGVSLAPHERSLMLAQFEEGEIQVICAVDIFNEGIDVPDVNILVFQRVTHSRRIFVQQLGRGLRLRPGKDKVIVLDFVSDIRRFAAGLDMQQRLAPAPSETQRVRLNSSVSFTRVGGGKSEAEPFLREWLHDVAAIESASEDAAVLKYPPAISSR